VSVRARRPAASIYVKPRRREPCDIGGSNLPWKPAMRLLLAIVAAALVATGSASAAEPAKSAAPAAPSGAGLGAMHAGMAKPVDAGDVSVAKAIGADARTVAEIVTGRTQLKNRTVVVRAKVVKFTPGVMGKNWLHVRDGSGSASDNTHDVVVTTKDETKVGEVVVAKGIVRTDVELGAGYTYKVLVEDAKLQK
jgi:hypothetical protein